MERITLYFNLPLVKQLLWCHFMDIIWYATEAGRKDIYFQFESLLYEFLTKRH